MVISGIIGFSGVAQADLDDGLVVYYPFEGNSNDTSGNENNGIESGGVTYSTGIIGQAAEFDGIDDFVEPSYGTLNSESFSLSFWLRTSAGNIDDTSMVFGGRTGRTSSIIYVATEFENKGDNEFFSQMMGFGGGERPEFDTNINLTDNQWHQVAITSDTSNYTLYVNGNLVASDSQTTSGNLTDQAVIGDYSNQCADLPACSCFEEDHHFNGMLDEFRIYNRALSESEIQELYNDSETNCPASDPASIGLNLDIHIPSAEYQSLNGTSNFWVDLEFKGTDVDGDMVWKLRDYGSN